MSKGKGVWSALMAIAITIVVVSTAYLAAGALYDRMLPEEERTGGYGDPDRHSN
ncbi:MAG: hypothetical protein AB9819_05150 [Methanomassiliicoccales archaeon]